MKIHSICVVKNEADIIDQTLKAAAVWSDFIYVLDNGSTDGTWEKVLSLAQKHPQIIPYKQLDCVYYEGLRSEIFHALQSNNTEGDWWCILDADEIYIDNPRIFLAKIPQAYQSVWTAIFHYYFTDKDLEQYEQNPGLYADEVSIEQKCRYYRNDWSEARFFRYDKNLVWEKHQKWPYTGAVYPVRIWLKHFQYRSPQQIQKRLNVRSKVREKDAGLFLHEVKSAWQSKFDSSSQLATNVISAPQQEDSPWKERIVNSSQLNYDAQDGRYIVREESMPQIPLIHPILFNRMRVFKKYINKSTLQKFLLFRK